MTERTARATDPAPAGRTAARWAVLCALLLGLFLMHGSPASATGCHPARPTPADTSTSAPASTPAGTPASTPMTAPMTAPTAGRGHHGDDPHGDGRPTATAPVRHGSPASACVSTQARDRLPLPAPGAALPGVLPQPPLAGPPCTGAERGGRAPPGGGRELLIRVCVARR
ncbi:hypothetical protein [Kitasatospora phosalacinea]|uniref:hypothetical protein n=1 Tax=Kitasatospora phosalacinea TaxID=2065 RepID=UPI0005261788|nr:hypothetical protein [Kitasatospora phosalacinea]